MKFENLKNFYTNLKEIRDVDSSILDNFSKLQRKKFLEQKFHDNPNLLDDYTKFSTSKPLTTKEQEELENINNYNVVDTCTSEYLNSIRLDNQNSIKHDIIMKINSSNKTDIDSIQEFFNKLNINIALNVKEDNQHSLYLTMTSYDLNNLKKGFDILIENKNIDFQLGYIIPDFKERSLIEINNEVKKQYVQNSSLDNVASTIGVTVIDFDYSDIEKSLYNSINTTSKNSLPAFLENKSLEDNAYAYINESRKNTERARQAHTTSYKKYFK